MDIRSNVDLADYTTMRLSSIAQHFTSVSDKEELVEALNWAADNDVEALVIGGGSNIIFKDGFDGLVIHNEISGIEIFEEGNSATLTAGSGEIWDDVVEKSVSKNLTGIEALSLIPGTVGATPVQNVGAYGQEIADTFVELEAYDIESGKFVTLTKHDCQFGYRTSRFKEKDHGRFFITSVTFELTKGEIKPPLYRSLQKYFDENNISDYSPASIREAVITVRQSKLPDPKKVPNTGSFFKNPIISQEHFNELKEKHPDIPGYESIDGVKVPAGWLIENAGFKGCKDECGMGTYEKHSLVLVNNSANNFKDLDSLATKIATKIEEKYDIRLQVEPEIISK